MRFAKSRSGDSPDFNHLIVEHLVLFVHRPLLPAEERMLEFDQVDVVRPAQDIDRPVKETVAEFRHARDLQLKLLEH